MLARLLEQAKDLNTAKAIEKSLDKKAQEKARSGEAKVRDLVKSLRAKYQKQADQNADLPGLAMAPEMEKYDKKREKERHLPVRTHHSGPAAATFISDR